MAWRAMLGALAVVAAAGIGLGVGFEAGRRTVRTAATRADRGAATAAATTATATPASPSLAPSLASLGPGVIACADASGRLFVLSGGPDGLSPLKLEGVYALRRSRERDLLDPDHRSGSGFYLDDLGREGAEAIAAARAAFAAEVGSASLDPEVAARALARARAILLAGDATTLLAALNSADYRTRRAAAIALGERGFVAAAPSLFEVIQTEPATTPGGAQAREILARLSGRPIATRAEMDAWWDALPARERVSRQ